MEKYNFGFNNKKFKLFKKELNSFVKDKYGKTLKEIFKDKKLREALYKDILGFNGTTDIFDNGNKNSIYNFDLDQDTKKIIEDIKNFTKKVI